jgi:hypothetical protein
LDGSDLAHRSTPPLCFVCHTLFARVSPIWHAVIAKLSPMFHTFLRGLSRRQLPPQEISPWPCLGFAQHSAERKVLAMQSNLLPEIVAQPSLEKVNVSKNGMAGDLAPVATALSARPQASKLKHFTASGNSFTGSRSNRQLRMAAFYPTYSTSRTTA